MAGENGAHWKENSTSTRKVTAPGTSICPLSSAMGRLFGGKSAPLLFSKPVSLTGWRQVDASDLSQSQALPNKRLKLTGGDRSMGTGSVVRWRARPIAQRHSARRASRPQLKRDPLGGPNTYAIMRWIVCAIIGAFLACHTRPSSDLPPAPATKSCAGLASPDSAVYEEIRVDVKPAIRVSPLLVYPRRPGQWACGDA